MPSANQLEATKRYLNSHHIFVDDTWLQEGLDYFMSEGVNFNQDVMNELKNQFFLNDLRITCKGCLPDNLNKTEVTLPHKYLLQIDSIIDIGKPTYQQCLELVKADLSNVEATKTFEEKIPTCRMLKLNMTDGVQNVTGIEYRTIKRLNVNIPPGFKVFIKGPVKCRNGTLLLNDHNYEPLDGEADNLVEKNSQWNLLESRLKALDPTKMARLALARKVINDSTVEVNSYSRTPYSSLPSNPSEITPSLFNQRTLPGIPSSSSSLQIPNLSKASSMALPFSSPLENSFCDDFQDMEFVEQLDKIEAQIISRSDTAEPPKKKVKPEEFPDDDKVFIAEDTDRPETNDNNVINISKLNEMQEKLSKTFTIRARVSSVITQLSVTKQHWKLSVNLSDDTGNIVVKVSHDVLQQLIRYTPKQMCELKRQLKKEPGLQKKAESILKDAKNQIMNLNSKMKIEFTPDSDVPTLVELSQ